MVACQALDFRLFACRGWLLAQSTKIILMNLLLLFPFLNYLLIIIYSLLLFTYYNNLITSIMSLLL